MGKYLNSLMNRIYGIKRVSVSYRSVRPLELNCCSLCYESLGETSYVIDQGVVDYNGVAVHGKNCCVSCDFHYQLYKTGWPSRDLSNLREIRRVKGLKSEIFERFGTGENYGDLLINLEEVSVIMYFPPEQYTDVTKTFDWKERNVYSSRFKKTMRS
jgi:hypothetical protein